MAEVQILPDYPKGLDFQQVWAALQETKQILRENAEQFAQQQKETDRQMKETDRQMKETDKRLGKLGNRMGEVIEYMVAPNLREKFRALGYDFPSVAQNSDVSDRKNNIYLEIDIKLENGDKAMLVEVKANSTIEDVKEHIERLEKMRRYADLHGDKRTFLGAVAGVVMAGNAKEYAIKQGFFVIEPSGETFIIISPNGEPKEW